MKINKTFGRVATTFLATAMLASVTAVPAFAADFTSDGTIDNADNSALTEITFKKQLVRPSTGDTPHITFNFTMTGTTGGETVTSNGNTTVVEDGKGTATGSVTFGDNSENEIVDTTSQAAAGKYIVTDNVTIDISSLTFTQPGVYKYSLTEASSDADVLPDGTVTMGIGTTPYSVYLFVENVTTEGVTTPTVTGAELFDASDREGDKTDTITNYYMTTPSTVTPNSVTIEKNVTGSMGSKDPDETFAFTVVITPADTGVRTYSYESDDENATVSENKLTYTANLAHGDQLTIYGLMAGDKYTVTEAGNNKGYTVTGVAVDGDPTVTEIENGGTVTFDVKEADKVTVTNTRNAVSPTGLAMDIAPYALLVVVAAAGCFVFLRKRNDD